MDIEKFTGVQANFLETLGRKAMDCDFSFAEKLIQYSDAIADSKRQVEIPEEIFGDRDTFFKFVSEVTQTKDLTRFFNNLSTLHGFKVNNQPNEIEIYNSISEIILSMALTWREPKEFTARFLKLFATCKDIQDVNTALLNCYLFCDIRD